MDLTKYRDQINEIDDQILALLQKRAEVSKRVGAVKAKTGIAEVYVPHRQKQIIERLKEQNHGRFPEAALEANQTLEVIATGPDGRTAKVTINRSTLDETEVAEATEIVKNLEVE